MADWLVSRPTIITLAVVGGVFAVLASLLRTRGPEHEFRVKQLNLVAYIFMAASMILFVIAGFWRGRA
jgi:uncharacterized membrane protein